MTIYDLAARPDTAPTHLTLHYGPSQMSSAICLVDSDHLTVQFSDGGYNEPVDHQVDLIPDWLSTEDSIQTGLLIRAFETCVAHYEGKLRTCDACGVTERNDEAGEDWPDGICARCMTVERRDVSLMLKDKAAELVIKHGRRLAMKSEWEMEDNFVCTEEVAGLYREFVKASNPRVREAL